MLNKQSVLLVKDNSKVLKVKIINLYLKKKIKSKNPFLGVVTSSNNISITKGSITNFLATNTKKKKTFFSGVMKKSDLNGCILLKNKKTLEPVGTRFVGSFFSDIKNVKNQKTKNLINKCI